MGEMFALRMDKSLRVATGLGLLLLLAAQEKVCPWLVTPPKPADKGAADPAARPDGKQDTRKKAKTRLPYLLPDAVAPRRPAACSEASSRIIDRARDGIVSCGHRDPYAGDDFAANPPYDPCAWHCFLEPSVPANAQPGEILALPPQNLAMQTAIQRTGPPRA